MTKVQFKVLVSLLIVVIVFLGVLTLKPKIGRTEREGSVDTVVIEKPQTRDACGICGRDRVSAHGGVLVKNMTSHQVTVHVRHHPDAPPTVITLDPEAFELVRDILVGKMMLRAVGEGFDEESFCTIQANTQHEMWWTTRGWEMHGATSMIGH